MFFIPSTIPEVEMEILLEPKLKNSGLIRIFKAFLTSGQLRNGSPMPIKTRLENFPASFLSLKKFLQKRTWSVISSLVKLRLNPPWPVAQKRQASKQPTWLETQADQR